MPKIQYLSIFITFQFTKIQKNRSKQFFYLHICLPLEPIETFKPHFKKSDGLKWRQIAYKVENLKKLASSKILSFSPISFKR